ncbi:Uncharacterised protein [Serratia fonticola]|nr:Uncharacterised protein [Serratia fonticola]
MNRGMKLANVLLAGGFCLDLSGPVAGNVSSVSLIPFINSML